MTVAPCNIIQFYIILSVFYESKNSYEYTVIIMMAMKKNLKKKILHKIIIIIIIICSGKGMNEFYDYYF